MVECALYVRVENILGFLLDREDNCSHGILTTSSGTKAITVGFKLGFPFRFEGHFYQCLLAAFLHGRNAEWTLFRFSWLGYPDASNWFGRVVVPMAWVNLPCHFASVFGFDGFHPVDPRRFLALVLLSHSPNGE
jgi:hypothetical protein